jgi:hypothetical protein
MPELDQLLMDAINERPDGDVLNIVQAARELEGDLYERFAKAYAEVTGNHWGDPDGTIGLPTPE